jgi:hypothetical protein
LIYINTTGMMNLKGIICFEAPLTNTFKQLSQWLTVSFTTGLRFTASAGIYLCTKT